MEKGAKVVESYVKWPSAVSCCSTTSRCSSVELDLIESCTSARKRSRSKSEDCVSESSTEEDWSGLRKRAKQSQGIYPAVQVASQRLNAQKQSLPEACIHEILCFAFKSCREDDCKSTQLRKFSLYSSCLTCENTCSGCEAYDCNLDSCREPGCGTGWRCFNCLVQCSSCSSRWCENHIDVAGKKCTSCLL